MHAAGFVLAGMRKLRNRAHPPMILAHSLTSDFFGIEERADYWPDFESFTTWPTTARLLWELRDLDRLAGQSSLDHFGHWPDPHSRRMILCTKAEAERAKWEARHGQGAVAVSQHIFSNDELLKSTFQQNRES